LFLYLIIDNTIGVHNLAALPIVRKNSALGFCHEIQLMLENKLLIAKINHIIDVAITYIK